MIKIAHGFICTDFGRWINLDQIKSIYIEYDDKMKDMAAIVLEFNDSSLFTLIIGDIKVIESKFEELFFI